MIRDPDKYPNSPPKAFDVDLDLKMKLAVNGDHSHHALEVAEEVVEVMAQNTQSVVDVKIVGGQAIPTNDIVADEPL